MGSMLYNKNIYVVAKIFDEQGCMAYRCKNADEARSLPAILETVRAEGIQIVILTDPDIYSEYAPYTYVDGMREFIDIVSDMKRKVAFA